MRPLRRGIITQREVGTWNRTWYLDQLTGIELEVSQRVVEQVVLLHGFRRSERMALYIRSGGNRYIVDGNHGGVVCNRVHCDF